MTSTSLQAGVSRSTTGATGDALAQLLLGWTTRGQLVDTDILNTRTDYWGFYAQDSWKATDRLTLNLGLRWEVDTPRWELNNRQSGFDPLATNSVCNCPGTMLFAGIDGRGKYAHDIDGNNFGPRIGFAYRAGGSTVIRAGYGVNYNGAYARAVPFTQFWTYSRTLDISSPDGGFTPVFLLSDGLPTVQPFQRCRSRAHVRRDHLRPSHRFAGLYPAAPAEWLCAAVEPHDTEAAARQHPAGGPVPSQRRT